MIYLAPLFIAIILRHYGLVYREDVGGTIAEIVLSTVLFVDAAKLRLSILVRHHPFSIATALFACFFYGIVFWYTLPNESWHTLFPLLALVSYDILASKEFRYTQMIPPRIKQFLSLDGIIRTIVIAVLLSFVLQSDWSSATYSLLIGAVFALLVFGFLYLTKQNAILYIVPLLTYFISKQLVGEGIIATLACGLLIGNFARSFCSDLISLFGKLYPVLFSITLFLFGLKFGETLLQTVRLNMVITTLLIVFLLHAVSISVIFLCARMHWQTFVIGSLCNLPGIVPFLFATLFTETNQGFLSGMLTLSFLLHVLYLPRLIRWYGTIFTGRDPFSRLQEHKPTIELPY